MKAHNNINIISSSDSMTTNPESADLFLVDLKLDARLKPTSMNSYDASTVSTQKLVSGLVAKETYAIGSCGKDDLVYYPGDLGFFGCVFEAWKNHWNLRTRPEDWWGPVAQKIAKAVDEAAKNSFSDEKVRSLFVSHEGKQVISVNLPSYTIYDSNYDVLFSQFSSQIEKRIKVPKYAQAMQNDFDSSGPAHKIASQINLMASMQQFFEYRMCAFGCGLRGLEMIGSLEDWDSLVTKLKEVREILEPIKDEIHLSFHLSDAWCRNENSDSWWNHVLNIFENLANTRKNPNDPKVAEFWINILMDTTGTSYVGGGGSMPGKPVQVKAYDGWLVKFLTGADKILAEQLTDKRDNYIKKELRGWNSVPMKVCLTWCTPSVEGSSTLVAGIVGYKVHSGLGQQHVQSETKELEDEQVPSVEANHMWAMLLPPDSELRG